MWCSPNAAPYESGVTFIDPSGRGKDETSYSVLKLLHGRMFLAASGGFLGGYDDKTLKALVAIAKKHDIKLILCEPNYGGGMFTKLLVSAVQQYPYSCGVEDADWSTVAKEQRIVDVLEPVLNQHRLIVCPSVIEQDFDSTKLIDGERGPLYRLFYQMTRMVRAKGALAQDDRLDALAGAVSYFVEHMARDTHMAALDHKAREFDKELEKFVKHASAQHGSEPPRRFSSAIMRQGK